MLRTELWHPLMAHFPIALLTLFPVLSCIYLVRKNAQVFAIKNVFLYGGAIFYFINLFTGDEAAGVIKNTFCHIVDVYAHEQMAEEGLIILIALIVINFMSHLPRLKTYLSMILIGEFLIGGLLAFWIGRTSHQGAMLVYDKGAAVKVFREKCD